MRRFLVVDDHPLFREALQAAIRAAYPDASVVEATTLEDGIAAATRQEGGFDLALLDLFMPGTHGFDGLLRLRASFPRLPVVIVTGMGDGRIARDALAYGAAGFIPKSAGRAELTRAIADVLNGVVVLPAEFETPAPRAVATTGPQDDLAQRLKALTPAQLRVLQMLRQGLLNKQIAHELDVSETTVKAHVSEVLRKLNVVSRTQAVIEASRIDFGPAAAPPDEA